jgi:hypothetical protein
MLIQTLSPSCEKRLLYLSSLFSSVCPSVGKHGTTWLPLLELYWVFVIEICPEKSCASKQEAFLKFVVIPHPKFVALRKVADKRWQEHVNTRGLQILFHKILPFTR